MGLIKREFVLPENDCSFLEETCRPFETVIDGSKRWVILHDWPICNGYNHNVISLAAQIQPGYPDTEIDMIYVYPALQRSDGKTIANLSSQVIDGIQWQRWSRHRTAINPWRPGVDNLEYHLALVNHWFMSDFTRRN